MLVLNNKTFLEIDSEEKAYFLGFFAASLNQASSTIISGKIWDLTIFEELFPECNLRLSFDTNDTVWRYSCRGLGDIDGYIKAFLNPEKPPEERLLWAFEHGCFDSEKREFTEEDDIICTVDILKKSITSRDYYDNMYGKNVIGSEKNRGEYNKILKKTIAVSFEKALYSRNSVGGWILNKETKDFLFKVKEKGWRGVIYTQIYRKDKYKDLLSRLNSDKIEYNSAIIGTPGAMVKVSDVKKINETKT